MMSITMSMIISKKDALTRQGLPIRMGRVSFYGVSLHGLFWFLLLYCIATVLRFSGRGVCFPTLFLMDGRYIYLIYFLFGACNYCYSYLGIGR